MTLSIYCINLSKRISCSSVCVGEWGGGGRLEDRKKGDASCLKMLIQISMFKANITIASFLHADSQRGLNFDIIVTHRPLRQFITNRFRSFFEKSYMGAERWREIKINN